jgi:hypothetical protein
VLQTSRTSTASHTASTSPAASKDVRHPNTPIQSIPSISDSGVFLPDVQDISSLASQEWRREVGIQNSLANAFVQTWANAVVNGAIIPEWVPGEVARFLIADAAARDALRLSTRIQPVAEPGFGFLDPGLSKLDVQDREDGFASVGIVHVPCHPSPVVSAGAFHARKPQQVAPKGVRA